MLTSFQEAWSGEESLSFHGAGLCATRFPGPHCSGWPRDFILETQGRGLSLKASCRLWRQAEDRMPEIEIKEEDKAEAQERRWKEGPGWTVCSGCGEGAGV